MPQITAWTEERIRAELDRCDREIAEMEAQAPVKPAWLVTLGIEDWECEKRLILAAAGRAV
jgi:hypothetical protein